MIEVLGGIAWHQVPAVDRYETKEGDAWYAAGVERVEAEGTKGWRHGERRVFLQENATWGKAIHNFPTEDAARSALQKAMGDSKPSGADDLSPFAQLLRAAQEAKERKKK
jgi:hypothetical protein